MDVLMVHQLIQKKIIVLNVGNLKYYYKIKYEFILYIFNINFNNNSNEFNE